MQVRIVDPADHERPTEVQVIGMPDDAIAASLADPVREALLDAPGPRSPARRSCASLLSWAEPGGYRGQVFERPSDPVVWENLRAICLALPDVSERSSHGELAWFVGDGRRGRQFAGTWDHHHDERNGVVMAAAPGVQDQLVAGDPTLYFRPPYVGTKGWFGMYLDVGAVDWDLVAVHLADAHATVGSS